MVQPRELRLPNGIRLSAGVFALVAALQGCDTDPSPNGCKSSLGYPPVPSGSTGALVAFGTWKTLSDSQAVGEIRNIGTRTATEVRVVIAYRDSLSGITPKRDTLESSAVSEIVAPPSHAGAIAIFPDVAEITWWDGTARGSNQTNRPASVIFTQWLSIGLATATGEVTNFACDRTADSIVVHVMTRNGMESVSLTPRYLYPDRSATFESPSRDSSGVAVAPIVQKITWIGGEWVPPVAGASRF